MASGDVLHVGAGRCVMPVDPRIVAAAAVSGPKYPTPVRRVAVERLGVAVVYAALSWAPPAALARGLGSSASVAFATGGLVAVALLVLLVRGLPRELDGLVRRQPWAGALWAVLMLAGVIMHARAAVYIVDPGAGHAGIVADPFYTPHSCLSAYYTAARVSTGNDPNLYAQRHYVKPKHGSPLGSFNQDDYFYPPPFLLLPRAILAMTEDYGRVRALWFVIESLILLAALWIMRAMAGLSWRATVLGVPLVYTSLPVLATLQAGNFQVVAIALAMLALAASRARQDALAGALLAFTTLSKIFPGILLVYLLARRRWATLTWTAVFAGVYLALGVGILGREPFVAFAQDMVPRLASGEAFSMLLKPAAIALNHSITGMVLKLRLLGLPEVSLAAAAKATWIYTAALVPLVYLAARRVRDVGRAELLFGLAVLHLGALRSPFTPDPYAAILPIWLCVVLFMLGASERLRMGGGAAALAVAYLALNVLLPGALAFTWPIGSVLAIAALPQLSELVIVAVALRVSVLWRPREAAAVDNVLARSWPIVPRLPDSAGPLADANRRSTIRVHPQTHTSPET